ncbi:MAG: pseudouridine synthase [Candidatus Paceibacterota bacterium]|jgi:23S rRNA pseudouridine2604 synthase
MDYPIRINKYLATLGVTTRRGADELVERRKVLLNGRLAKLGDLVQAGDKVLVKDLPTDINENFVYFAYHKPRGEETGKLAPDKFPQNLSQNIFPVGRLDKGSSGLLIMTNDGRITDRLLGPTYKHEKEYEVETDKSVNGFMLKRMEMGVNIEGYKTKKCQAEKIGPKIFRIILTEGKKHQIRRMCAAVGLQVKNLKRVRIMNIKLGNLKPGRLRPIIETQKVEFLKTLSLSP